MLWPNKNPPNTIFLDKEIGLARPPHVFGEWRYLPFKDNSFDCIMFDPPHLIFMGPKSMHRNPQDTRGWWGINWPNRMTLLRTIVGAQREFARVAKRLIFKWGESRDGGKVDKLIPLFSKWQEIYRYTRPSQGRFRNPTHWVTMILRTSRARGLEVARYRPYDPFQQERS